jgi:hypothetical protein
MSDRGDAQSLTGRRLPDFFIVGHPKSGTTALYEMLRQHPQIYMPDVKEPSFFVPEILGRDRTLGRARTLDYYLRLFEAAEPQQRAGEASPTYLWSSHAAERIGALRPDARIIAILREPASYLRSLHLELLRINAETEKHLGDAIALEPIRREGKAIPPDSTRPQLLLYSENVRYVTQLQRYHAVFPREQVLVLIYEEYRADNQGTIRQILRFLDVDDTYPLTPIEAKPSERVRSPRLLATVRAVSLGRRTAPRLVKSGIKLTTTRRLRRRALALQRRAQLGSPRPPDEQLMLDLRRRFRAEVVALSEYLNRDIVKLWGYDRLD